MEKSIYKIVLILCAILIFISCSDSLEQSQGPPGDRKWKLVWNDEFDGTSYDTTRWYPADGTWTLKDIETQQYDGNLIVDGKGHLMIRLSKNDQGALLYHNGLITHYEKAYGYFEARVQFSTEPGWWTAFWLSGHPYDEGDDCFVYPQEFDIYEDFYKPKEENDIYQCYHANAGLPRGTETGESGKEDMMKCKEVRRHSLSKKFILDKYEGWHTVALEWAPLEHIFYIDGKINHSITYRECPITNVPQKIWMSGCFRTPEEGVEKVFYGFAKDGKWPDQVVFDYVRVYDQDWEDKKAPEVTVVTLDFTGAYVQNEPVQFRVSANDEDGIIKTLYLFSKGRIRAEVEGNAAREEHIFTINNLFPGENTIIAMAKDNDGRVGQSPMLRIEIDK